MVKHPPVSILILEPFQGLGLNRKLVKHFIEQLVNNSETQLYLFHQDLDAPELHYTSFEFIRKR